jgi:hypothetical protein
MDISKTKDLIVKMAKDNIATQSRSVDIQAALESEAQQITQHEVSNTALSLWHACITTLTLVVLLQRDFVEETEKVARNRKGLMAETHKVTVGSVHQNLMVVQSKFSHSMKTAVDFTKEKHEETRGVESFIDQARVTKHEVQQLQETFSEIRADDEKIAEAIAAILEERTDSRAVLIRQQEADQHNKQSCEQLEQQVASMNRSTEVLANSTEAEKAISSQHEKDAQTRNEQAQLTGVVDQMEMTIARLGVESKAEEDELCKTKGALSSALNPKIGTLR